VQFSGKLDACGLTPRTPSMGGVTMGRGQRRRRTGGSSADDDKVQQVVAFDVGQCGLGGKLEALEDAGSDPTCVLRGKDRAG
jgi:hypothetical protein